MKKKLNQVICVASLLASSTPILAYTCPNNYTYHMLVNSKSSIDSSYKPKQVTVPNVSFSFSGQDSKKNMEYEAAKALENLFTGAKAQGINLKAVSGYRSYERQKSIYNAKYAQYGANLKANAKPGESEHQTGLAMDVSAASVGYDLVQRFEYTKEGQWLANNSHNYGFIIRYPKGKEHITGYIYEPWHIRYVGEELAEYLYENKLTLDEIESCCKGYKEVEKALRINDQEPVILQLIEKENLLYIWSRDLANLLDYYLEYQKPILLFKKDNLEITYDESLAIIEETKTYVPLREVALQLGYQTTYSNSELRLQNR